VAGWREPSVSPIPSSNRFLDALVLYFTALTASSGRAFLRQGIMLLNHTGWGFTTFTDEKLIARLSKLTGDSSSAPMRFFCLRNPEQNTREQIRIVRFTSRERNRGAGAGFVLNMDTGILSEVRAAPQQTGA
jgi:carbonic anhydrase